MKLVGPVHDTIQTVCSDDDSRLCAGPPVDRLLVGCLSTDHVQPLKEERPT